ncbi:hypothetical protein GTCCBUS3UF5_7390 [Geobacillus thermoleovorans CCB_US3_UF5]|uniref:Uncharacterized protein n=2 Tax=Geobacillus thermoleovorans group TaxID=1505648 RepID=U2YAE9_GEOKU|nr:hypothetical protein GTCCBUS3UF5_7390 [Geobacillus thermoleovorans CCB_US3_UF5]GAD13803.1 hypothetical protein GBL_2020 [Geobacillus kaustophilus GBlys]GAJ60042.1 hypothetical protein B23_3268 [Geobacillus thermoleovorans B23]
MAKKKCLLAGGSQEKRQAALGNSQTPAGQPANVTQGQRPLTYWR